MFSSRNFFLEGIEDLMAEAGKVQRRTNDFKSDVLFAESHSFYRNKAT
jgi:hypothetical protein